MNTSTTAPLTSEILEVGNYIDEMGHRAVCSCGWVSRLYPLGYLDSARAALAEHAAAHAAA